MFFGSMGMLEELLNQDFEVKHITSLPKVSKPIELT
jgi:hypothetical protein